MAASHSIAQRRDSITQHHAASHSIAMHHAASHSIAQHHTASHSIIQHGSSRYRLRTINQDWCIYITDAGQRTHFHMCFDAARYPSDAYPSDAYPSDAYPSDDFRLE
jgi:hypothetical protein